MTNMNSLFKFLNDLSENLSKNTQIETLDFTKKEDVEKLENAIDKLKSSPFLSQFFDNDIFDALLEKANKIYNESHKQTAPKRPSIDVNEKVKNNVLNIVNEYVDTMITPYIQLDDTKKQDIIDSLFEFACWMYNK